MVEERLQKVMAAAGVASRRACEKLIEEGRVQVDGQVVTVSGLKVDADKAEITVDGQSIKQPKRHVYYKIYKPRGVLSDIGGDTRGRQTVVDLLPESARRVFPVGRLDLISEGMVLLTDDGELANRLTHPRYEHPKTYYVLVEKLPGLAALDALRTGIDLPTGRTRPCQVSVVDRLPPGLILDTGNVKGVWLRFVLREGKKRQIRHMTAAVEHPTQRLVRWAIGPITVEGVKPGEYRALTGAEVAALRAMIAGTGQELPEAPDPRRIANRTPRAGSSSPGGKSPRSAGGSAKAKEKRQTPDKGGSHPFGGPKTGKSGHKTGTGSRGGRG